MATKNSNNSNGNVATDKKFDYKDLLAKALGEKVTPVSEKVKDTDELFAKAMEKAKPAPGELAGKSISERDKPSKTSQQLMEEINESILNSESQDDVEDVEIIEVIPVAGKKIIPQTSAQAQKLLAKVNPVKPKSFSEMTDEEKLARRKEISAKALEAKRAKKAQAEPEPKPEPTTPFTRTRTNVSKPETKTPDVMDSVMSLIGKGKGKENRAELNQLLLKYKGLTLEKVEESAGHLNDDEVIELISKIKEETPNKVTEGKGKGKETTTRTRTVPPKKTNITRAETYSLVLANSPESIEEWAKMSDELFVESGGKSNINQAMADVKWLEKFLKHFKGYENNVPIK